MENGAVIIKIGGAKIITANPYKTEDDTREYLLNQLSSALAEAKRLGLTPDTVSIHYDPNYQWDLIKEGK